MFLGKYKPATVSSTVVEHSAHSSEVKGLSPAPAAAAGTDVEKAEKNNKPKNFFAGQTL